MLWQGSDPCSLKSLPVVCLVLRKDWILCVDFFPLNLFSSLWYFVKCDLNEDVWKVDFSSVWSIKVSLYGKTEDLFNISNNSSSSLGAFWHLTRGYHSLVCEKGKTLSNFVFQIFLEICLCMCLECKSASFFPPPFFLNLKFLKTLNPD